ncbi:MAG TPA: GrpB family protein [Trebonia sp.]|nr:GrpB family protein [Trebonia sp.]
MTDALPRWATERPKVQPHDPLLAIRARDEAVRLAEILAPWLVDGVEHVGSTAVPGLAAKPIIDLMVSVSDLDRLADEAGGLLATDGWCYVPPELDQRDWRRFFVKPDAEGARRVAHLHAIPAGHPRWAQQIAFRDALRADDQLARAYEDVKRRAAARHHDDREAYTAAKTQFVIEVLASVSPALSRLRYN